MLWTIGQETGTERVLAPTNLCNSVRNSFGTGAVPHDTSLFLLTFLTEQPSLG